MNLYIMIPQKDTLNMINPKFKLTQIRFLK